MVLFLHGGGFVTGKPEDDLSMTARLATYLSRRVCVPRYRLAPEHPFPAARDDAMAVYRELVDGAKCCGNWRISRWQSRPGSSPGDR